MLKPILGHVTFTPRCPAGTKGPFYAASRCSTRSTSHQAAASEPWRRNYQHQRIAHKAPWIRQLPQLPHFVLADQVVYSEMREAWRTIVLSERETDLRIM